MKSFITKKDKAGFTLVELIVVIAILGILAAIALPRLSGYTEKSKIKADEISLDLLNKMTDLYAVTHNINEEDVFAGISPDKKRIETLVTDGLLDKFIEPQQKKFKFKWNVNDQLWILSKSYGSYNTTMGSSGKTTIQELIHGSENAFKVGGWNEDGEGIISVSGGREQLLFVKNNNEEYSITTRATLLGESGGYGIFFETSLNEGKDTGYILQFDRGFRGIIVRKREWSGNTLNETLLSWENGKNKIDLSSEDSDWWTEEHTVRLEVKDAFGFGNKKKLTIYIDPKDNKDPIGSLKFEGLKKEEATTNNYTGFRSWGKVSTFTGLEIE